MKRARSRTNHDESADESPADAGDPADNRPGEELEGLEQLEGVRRDESVCHGIKPASEAADEVTAQQEWGRIQSTADDDRAARRMTSRRRQQRGVSARTGDRDG